MIIDLYLKGELVIVIGGGDEGMLKIRSLLTQDCKILLFSEESNNEIEKYVKQKKITFKKKKISNLDFLEKYKPIMIMGTTDDKELNRKIYQKAKTMNCHGYAVDDPMISDFSHPSLINIENIVQIAISTQGKSPIMAKKFRIEAEKIFKKVMKFRKAVDNCPFRQLKALSSRQHRRFNIACVPVTCNQATPSCSVKLRSRKSGAAVAAAGETHWISAEIGIQVVSNIETTLMSKLSR